MSIILGNKWASHSWGLRPGPSPSCDFSLVYWWAPVWPQACTGFLQDTLCLTARSIPFLWSPQSSVKCDSSPSLLSRGWVCFWDAHRGHLSCQIFIITRLITTPPPPPPRHHHHHQAKWNCCFLEGAAFPFYLEIPREGKWVVTNLFDLWNSLP